MRFEGLDSVPCLSEYSDLLGFFWSNMMYCPSEEVGADWKMITSIEDAVASLDSDQMMEYRSLPSYEFDLVRALGSTEKKGWVLQRLPIRVFEERTAPLGHPFRTHYGETGSTECAAGIYSILTTIFLDRAVRGKGEYLCEETIRVFKAGGLPCGWIGSRDDGHPLVYMPTDEERRQAAAIKREGDDS